MTISSLFDSAPADRQAGWTSTLDHSRQCGEQKAQIGRKQDE